eukprot:9725729-Ditylum_brightwellii.AAC.1
MAKLETPAPVLTLSVIPKVEGFQMPQKLKTWVNISCVDTASVIGNNGPASLLKHVLLDWVWVYVCAYTFQKLI